MAGREFKLVFAGSMGAGKTTAIAAISEIPPVRTDVGNTDRASHDKATTTTALDYGEVTLDGGDTLRLYGAPGQARFDFMWPILAEGALGVVVLVDNSRPDPIADLRGYLRTCGDTLAGLRGVIGIGRTESHPQPALDDYWALADQFDLAVPILSVDVRRRDDVLLLLNVLLTQLEAAEAIEDEPRVARPMPVEPLRAEAAGRDGDR